MGSSRKLVGHGNLVHLIFLVPLFTLVLVGLISAQNSGICECSNGEKCEKNVSVTECASGKIMGRQDCPCCLVCAKQLTDECNHKDLICDTDSGLICGKDLKCQADRSCVDDEGCSAGQFCFGGACADPCKVLPDVCLANGPSNGICVVRNHRAICSCPPTHKLEDNKCSVEPTEKIERTFCEDDGRNLEVGQEHYAQNCTQKCVCGADGSLSCEKIENPPQCSTGFFPMSNLTGEISKACQLLLEDHSEFNGCCLPEACQNNVEIASKTNLESELTHTREMLLSEDDSPVLEEIHLKSPHKKQGGVKDKIKKLLFSPHSESMKVVVSSTTSSSASISLPVHEKGAILSISLTNELKSRGGESVWKEHKIPPGLPMLVLSDLLPDTSYTIKYSVANKTYPTVQFQTNKIESPIEPIVSEVPPNIPISPIPPISTSSEEKEEPTTNSPSSPNNEENNKNENEKEGATTTLPSMSSGCLYNGTLHEVGSILLDGCDERCECEGSGEMKCSERCGVPFFKKGSFAHDPYCFEEDSGLDECCVIVACAKRSHTENDGRDLKMLSPCESVKCGRNAECRSEVSPAGMEVENEESQETLCICKDGFIGDPYDETKGCETGVSPISTHSNATSPPTITANESSNEEDAESEKTSGCVFNNKTFAHGEEYLDGCNYKCHCEASGESLCVPRCSYRRDEETEVPEGCKVEKDKSDAECCEILVCSNNTSLSTKKEKSQVPSDGCSYKNETYARDEKFFDGCEQQCMCFSNGDVTCQPRCPPTGPVANLDKDCLTLPDPADSCCNVTICGNHTISDVMKQAVESERLRLSSSPSTPKSPRILIDSSESELESPTLSPMSKFASSTQKSLSSSPPTEKSPRLLLDPLEPESPTLLPISKIASSEEQLSPIRITMAFPLNESAIMISVLIPEDEMEQGLGNEDISILYSTNSSLPDGEWEEVRSRLKELMIEGEGEVHMVVSGLEGGREYFFKAKLNGTESNVGSARTKARGKGLAEGRGSTSAEISSEDNSSGPSSSEVACTYKSKKFSSGEEFYDGCDAYCACDDAGTVQCVPIECPSEFGLDLRDAHCVKWEPVGKGAELVPPNCCPEMKCVQNSSCVYEGESFRNFDEIPERLTGCEKRCYCEFGNITCSNLCPEMSEKPPANLGCPPEMALPLTSPTDECCLIWTCRGDKHNKTLNVSSPLPPRFRPPVPPGTLYAGEDDQHIPPSVGNIPSVLPLGKFHHGQIQEFLHQLTANPHGPGLGGGGHGSVYVTVKNPEEIRELERIGARVVGEGEDNSFILVLPPRPPYPLATRPGPGSFPFGPHLDHNPSSASHDEITEVMIRPINESALHIDFTVSPVLVGLQGAVEILYTKDFATKPDPAQWKKQLFQQPEDIIDNSHLQLFLTGLSPNSEYHIQIQVILANVENSPISDIFAIRTPPPAPPAEIKIDPEIKVLETKGTSAEISWRKFTDFESSLIDGVQIKYRAYGDQLYTTTELIHRSLSHYNLTNLVPGSNYEVNLLLLPFMNQTTELQSVGEIHILTLPDSDEFSFTVSLSTGKVKEKEIEVVVEGVPFPEDKFVNIYQVRYQTEGEKEEKSYFKVPNRDTNKKAMIVDLKPGTRYKVWLEAFLTNGKKKRSDVIEVLTKEGSLPSPEKSEQETSNLLASRSQGIVEETTSYYGAIVALAIVATLSVFGIIVLLMILIKRQHHSKIPINDRKSESSYDNPSFKNYDIEANGHNKPSEL